MSEILHPGLLTSRIADAGTIVSSAGTDSDFPASNLLDPDPRRVWRAGTLGWTPGAASSDVNFTLDLGSNSAESIDTFALLFGHFVGGTNVFSPDGDGLRIRIRVGPANGTWTTYDSSFLAGFNLIHHNPWPFYASALSGSYPLNDYRNSTFYGYNAHIIHHLDAPLPVESTPGTPSCRFIRIDIGYHSTPLPEPVGLYTTPLQFGRLMIGLARVAGVQHGSGISTPIGAPPRSRVSWSLDVDRDEIEETVHALLSDVGSSPEVVRSWGGDLHPVDGVRTVLAMTDVRVSPQPVPAPASAATTTINPWRLQQGATYGYISQVSEITVPGPRRRRLSLQIQGMG